MAITISDVDLAAKNLKDAITAENTIELARGDQFVLPHNMTLLQAAKYLEDLHAAQEEAVEDTMILVGHPNDTLWAWHRAMEQTFGKYLSGKMKIKTMFGAREKNAESRTITIGWKEEVQIPYAKLSTPLNGDVDFVTGIEEDENDMMNSTMYISSKYRRKYAVFVKGIYDLAKKILTEDSVFRGKAVSSRFEFINPVYAEGSFVPSVQEEKDLNANIFAFIKNWKENLEAGISLKRTNLLYGDFGTGKTITTLVTAKYALENGWTYLHVAPDDDSFTRAFNFAKKFEPCVVVFEDVDSVTSGGKRTPKINDILNTLDGILSKEAKVLTVFTTNNTNDIEKGMVRPGRIDMMIQMGIIDEQAVHGIIEYNLANKNHEVIDSKKVLDACVGYSPAYVAEAAKRAVLYAISEGHRTITTEDIVYAANGLRGQFNLMKSDANITPSDLEDSFRGLMGPVVNRAFEDFKSQLNPQVLAKK